MNRQSEIDPMAQGAEPQGRSERFGSQGRLAYQPPRIERFGKLDKVAQFNGSQQVDSGGGLGPQGRPPFQP